MSGDWWMREANELPNESMSNTLSMKTFQRAQGAMEMIARNGQSAQDELKPTGQSGQ